MKIEKWVGKKNMATFQAAVLLLLVGAVIVGISLNHVRQWNLDQGNMILEGKKNQIQYAIDSRLLNLTVLEMMVVENNGDIKNFEKVASLIYENDPCVRCIQLAPNGVISYIYPLEGNESGFGNLFKNPKRRDEAIYARDTGNMTLAGPFELHQGGIGVVARRPIYLPNVQNENKFWGFSIQVMDLDALLEAFDVDALSQNGYDYRLWRFEPKSTNQQVFAGHETMPEHAIRAEIVVPGHIWYLDLIPTNGWLPKNAVLSHILFCLLFVILLTIIFHYTISIHMMNQRLNTIISRDQLTALYNRRFFYSILDQLLDEHTAFVLYYIDLNKFKLVNDTYGHAIGDGLLIQIGKRLKEEIGATHKVFRIGGDEFSIIVLNPDDASAANVEKGLSRVFQAPFVVDNISLQMDACYGHASYPLDASDATDLVRMADREMYRKKHSNDTIVLGVQAPTEA